LEGFSVIAAEQLCEKERVQHKLQEMGLDQIADWVHALPEDRWKDLFMLRWPTLVRKCGMDT
jgi:hypothetical protein